MSPFRHALCAAVAVAALAGATPNAEAASAVASALPTGWSLQSATVGSTTPVEFDVVLPLSNSAGLDTLLAQQANPASSLYHQWLTPAAFAAQFGPPAALVNVATFLLQAMGFSVTQQARSLHVRGTAGQVSALFGVTLSSAKDAVGRTRLVTGSAVTWPASLANFGIIVPAFHPGRTDASPMATRAASGYAVRAASGYTAQATGSATYLFNDLKQAYAYPAYRTASGATNDGTGATVAVIMASDVQDSDVASLFDGDNFKANSGQAADPAIFARRPVDGGPTAASDATSAEEATLDVEQVLGGAPGSHVILYDTPDLGDQSLVSALVAVDNDNAADVVSMSYGVCELYYTAAYNSGVDQTALLRLYSELYKQGNAQGITFLGGAGDAGGLGCQTPSALASGTAGGYVAGVAVPAADPDVTAVGGTNLVTARAAGGTDSSYLRENSFADILPAGAVFGAGGGVSTIFAKPSWQGLVSTGSSAYRTLPDIGMQVGGCPSTSCGTLGTFAGDTGERSGTAVVFNGAPDVLIGTSAAAPEMASVVALMVQAQGRQGNLNPALYTLAQAQGAGGTAVFHQNIAGNDGVTSNTAAYDYRVGNGTPIVSALLGMAGAPVAGAPGTSTNP